MGKQNKTVKTEVMTSDIEDINELLNSTDNETFNLMDSTTAEEILARRDELLGIAEKRRIGKRTVVNQYGKKIVTHANVVHLNAGKIFKDTNDFIVTFEHYINEIQENGYNELPTLLNFAKYVRCSPHTIQNYLYGLTETDRKIYKSILADMLYQGVNEGAYDKQMTIFAMKNLCDWSDRVESTSKIEKKKEIISKEEADKLIKEYVAGLEEC